MDADAERGGKKRGKKKKREEKPNQIIEATT